MGMAMTSPNREIGPAEVNALHTHDDLDTGSFSHHHTLGPLANQAAPGPHKHDGRDSAQLKLGTVTGSRGGNAALASLLTLLANKGVITDSSTP